MKHIITLKELLGVLLIIFILFSIYTFPLVLNMGDIIYGKKDVGVYYWNIYNFKLSLFQGEGIPFIKSEMILHPHGANLFFHTNSLGLCIYALFFDNHLLAMNTYALWHLLLGGVGMYMFTKHMTGDKAASLFSAVLFCFCSYSTVRFLEHINLISTGLIPFYLLCFFKTFSFKEGTLLPRMISRKLLLWLIALFIANLLLDKVITMSLALGTVAVFFGQALLYVYHNTRKKYFWIGFIALFVIGHLIIVVLKKGLQLDHGEGFYFSGDLIWFFIPVGKWLMSFELFDDLLQASHGDRLDSLVFLGFSTLIVVGVCLWHYFSKQPKDHMIRLFMVTAAIVLFIMHPEVRVLHNKLFYSLSAILHFIPLLNNYRVPTRLVIILIPFILVMCGLIMQQMKASGIKKIIWPAAFVVLVIEFYPLGYQQYNKEPEPAYYEFLSRQEGETALMIPFSISDGSRMFGDAGGTHQYYHQDRHHKKMINGYISRLSDEIFEVSKQDSVLQHFTRLQKEENAPAACDVKEAQKFMKYYSPDWIVVSPPYANDKLINYIKQSFKEYIVKIHEVEGAYLFALKPM